MATAAEYEALARRIAYEEFGNTPLAEVFLRMMRQESAGFSPDVVEGRRRSSAGAIGIAQFMPQTAASLGVDPLNPEAALRGGARYLKSNIQQFGDVAKGVAAYNAGGGNVQNAVARGGANWVNFLPGETQTYLKITQPNAAQDQAATAPAQAQQPARSPYVFPVQGYQGNVDLHWGEDAGAADIFAAPGTPILAMTGGQVVSAGWSDLGGWNVTIEGDDHNLYYMAHMQEKPLVSQGRVEAGTPIGAAGDTGNAKGKGAHLHIGIGPTIQSGAGPRGGSGANFDAVGLLRNTLAGTVPDAIGGAAPGSAPGGAAMPTPSPYQDMIAGLLADNQKDQQRLNDLLKQPVDVTSEDGLAARAEIGNLQAAIGVRNEQLAQLRQLDSQERTAQASLAQQTTANQVNAATGLAGVRQNAFDNAMALVNAQTAMVNAGFGNQLNLAQLINTIADANRTARLQELNAMVAMGNLDMAQAAMRFDVQERQSAAELAWTVQAAAKAGFIADENRKNALMLLPEGTHFQPGFEPSGALASTFQRWGIPPMVIGVAEVDRSSLDPMANLQRGAQAQEAMGAPRPQFDTAETTAAADRVRGVAGTDVSLGRITPASVGVPGAAPDISSLVGGLPGLPDQSQVEAYLQSLLAPQTIPPPALGGSAPAAAMASTNPTNAPLGPNATGFINAEAQTANQQQAARDTLQAAATPAGLARRDAGLPVIDTPASGPVDAARPGAAVTSILDPDSPLSILFQRRRKKTPEEEEEERRRRAAAFTIPSGTQVPTGVR